MRHRVEGRTLGREADHRRAMLRNLVKSLVLSDRIITTHTRALEAKKIADRLITHGKKGSVHSQRLLFNVLQDRNLVKKMMTEVVPKFDNRNGGYTRIIKKGFRKGDGAPTSILEWTYFSIAEVVSKHSETETSKASSVK